MNVCKYCFEPIPIGYFCCRDCFKEFESPNPLHGIRLVEEKDDEEEEEL